MRVFKESEGGFKLLRGAASWSGVSLQFFDDDELVLLQPGDAPFVSGDDRRRGGFHDPVEQLLDLLFGLAQVIAQSLGDLLGAGRVLLPCVEEQVLEQAYKLRGGAKPLQQDAELLLDHIALDGLAPAGAAFGEAEIVGMPFSGLALGPACGERPAAFRAHGISAQREVPADIRAGEDARPALDALLDALEGLKIDQPFVMALAQGYAPMGHLDISGIVRAAQEAQHLLVADGARFRLAGIFRLGFEEVLHLALRLEAARCEALKGFLHDGSQRLVAHEQEPVPGNPLVFITRGRVKHPIAVHDAGAHAVFGLLAVLLALVLAGAGQHVLDEDGIGILPEGDGGAFQLAACKVDGKAQIGMDARIARKAADVINHDDDLARAAVMLEEREHGHDARPVGQRAGDGLVEERLDDLIALAFGVFPAAHGLGFEAVALRHLLGAGNAGIDDGSCSECVLVVVGAHAFFLRVCTPSWLRFCSLCRALLCARRGIVVRGVGAGLFDIVQVYHIGSRKARFELRIIHIRTCAVRVIHEALRDQPERADIFNLLGLAEVHAIQMVEVFFNVEFHGCRASFPAKARARM